MTERKKPVRKKTAGTGRTSTTKTNTNKTASNKFYSGMGNEVTGVLLIGLGLFLTAGIFTDKIGRLGEFFKNLVFSITGFTGYFVPILFILWGFSFIIRKSGLFAGRRTVGVIIILLSLGIILSLKNTHLGDELGFAKALSAIPNLPENNHGGILGFVLAYPVEKMIGVAGTYIFSVIGVLLGAVLLLNTTFYDSLRKGKHATEALNTQLKDRMAERRERQILEKKEEEKRILLNKMEVPELGRNKDGQANSLLSDENEINQESEESALTFKNFKFGPKGKDSQEEQRLKLPDIHIHNEGSSELTYAGTGENQNPANKFNIELKNTKSGANQSIIGDNNVSTPEIKPPFKGKTGLELSDLKANPEEDIDVKDEVITHQETETKLTDKNKTVDTPAAPITEEAPLTGKQLSVDSPEVKKKKPYNYPEALLLKENIKGLIREDDRKEIIDNAQKLQEILKSFSIDATVINVSKGPTVTRYELQPKPGIKVSKIVGLSDDIAMGLAATGVRIEAPIPGKGAVGIEIPNKETSPVFLREVIESDKFKKTTQKLAIALGKDISGEAIVGDLTRYPHVLIAGATGSGKSVCINSLIVSLLYKYTPEEVRLIMVDPKMVELSIYNGIPHLLIPVVTDPKKAAGALNWAVNEMTRRYKLFADNSVKNIDGYNDLKLKGKIDEKLPYIVIIVDELADLMMVAANEVENYVMRLAQMARAAGMHLVIATQRPSVDVITGVIKANIPSRISFAVSSYVDSKTILDQAGAEKLLGKGDMLYCPVGVQKAKRIQGAFISEEEVEAIVEHIKVIEEEVEYDENIINHIEYGIQEDGTGGEDSDELLDEAIRIVVENKQASTSYLQRRMRIGYNRAARIVDELEQKGVISGPDGSKPRRVLWGPEDLNR